MECPTSPKATIADDSRMDPARRAFRSRLSCAGAQQAVIGSSPRVSIERVVALSLTCPDVPIRLHSANADWPAAVAGDARRNPDEPRGPPASAAGPPPVAVGRRRVPPARRPCPGRRPTGGRTDVVELTRSLRPAAEHVVTTCGRCPAESAGRFFGHILGHRPVMFSMPVGGLVHGCSGKLATPHRPGIGNRLSGRRPRIVGKDSDSIPGDPSSLSRAGRRGTAAGLSRAPRSSRRRR